MNRIQEPERTMSRVTWFALAVLLLTSVHHVYGAYLYGTPWRMHAAYVSAFAAAGIAASLLAFRRATHGVVRKVAFWLFVGVTLVVPVLLIGVFEGGYNHVLKNILYFAGAPASLMARLFPPPTYEMPNDLFFEATGVMQFVPAMVTGWLLYRLTTAFGSVSSPRQTVAGRPASAPVHARRRLDVGEVVTGRTLATVSSERIEIPDSARLVHLQFRRFAGCPVCNLHLHSFSRRYREIVDAGVREVVVFHSNADLLLPYTADLPFAVVADPDKRLYVEFGVESSPRALLDPRAWPAIARGVLRSLVAIVRDRQPIPSMNPDGGRFGLPADFLIASDGRVLACKYGVHADDQWSVDEVVALARGRTREAAARRRADALRGGHIDALSGHSGTM